MKNFVFILLIGLILVIACGGGKPLDSKYHGNWSSENGASLYMEADGKAGFKVGNKTVTGGGAVIDEEKKTLTISLFGISETWKIDQEPNEKGEMKLSGVVFKRK